MHRYPGSLGLTMELCAGITDKDKSLEQTMQEELEEEIGYRVPLDRIKKVHYSQKFHPNLKFAFNQKKMRLMHQQF